MAIHYEEGLYRFRVVSQGWTETKKAPPRPMFVINGDPISRIHRGEDGSEYEDSVDRDQYDRRIQMLIDPNDVQSQDFAMKKLRYAGFEGDSFSDLDLVGKDIRARCTHGEYNQKPKEDWDFALPDRESNAKPLDSGMARKLDALFGKKLKDGAKPKASPARPEVVSEKPSHAASYEAQRPAASVHRSTSSTPNDEVPF